MLFASDSLQGHVGLNQRDVIGHSIHDLVLSEEDSVIIQHRLQPRGEGGREGRRKGWTDGQMGRRTEKAELSKLGVDISSPPVRDLYNAPPPKMLKMEALRVILRYFRGVPTC